MPLKAQWEGASTGQRNYRRPRAHQVGRTELAECLQHVWRNSTTISWAHALLVDGLQP